MHRILILTVGILLMACGSVVQARGLVLESAMVSRSGNEATITIRLGCSHRYVDHYPLGASRQAQINLVPLDDCAAQWRAGVREASRPAGRDLAALDDLEYVSRSESEGLLLLRFSEAVSVQVHQRGDLHTLIVQVTPTGSGFQAKATPVPAIEPVPAASSAPVPRTEERVQRAEQRAREQLDAVGKTVHTGDYYAINLESALAPIGSIDPVVAEHAGGRQAYLTEVNVGGQTWYRLRIGFFATEAQAESMLASLRDVYPRAWVTRVSSAEWTQAAAHPVSSAAQTKSEAIPAATESTAAGSLPALDDDALRKLMDEGRNAMLAGDLTRAIQVYTRVLQEPENQWSAQAREYLGLARERNGQKAHAIAEYRRFLELYPESDAAGRVRQRLAGLTAVTAPKTASTGSGSARRGVDQRRWDVYGGFAQYYRLDQSQFNDQSSRTNQSSVLSDVDVIARRRGERLQFSSRATLGNLYDLLSDGPGTSTRVYYLYADLLDDVTGLGLRLGRQSQHKGGVLGRFDGAELSWQWRPQTRFSFLTGFPVDSSRDGFNTDRQFYGLSVDFLQLLDLFDLNLFYNAETMDGLENRNAIGAEVRYFDQSRSVIANIDYDTSYAELNALTILGNWTLDNRLGFNLLLDKRKSPFLLTRNALIGQQVTSIQDLQQLYTDDEIRALASDRTADMTAVTVGVSTPLFERFQINADITANKLGGTPASGGVPAMPDQGTSFYYSLNLIGSSLFTSGDSSILGLRYSDGVNSTTTSVSVDSRFPLTRKLRLNPRIRVSHRTYIQDDSIQWILAPAIRVFYRLTRHYTFELETGGEWSDRNLDTGSSKFKSFFVYAGYRADF